ncbi:MAG: restriction endonuclease subunit R [Candidatus Handelsmanbacteria bacterium RIFCSPLOWO2_12_FULL_64_10]|uniref:Restriction endonuclease subunit R n=1 Tax=Handelsmanbacteria sp. (strain RIFCSPLOWO2_12_FULL_64_10) TaxID=1817868 RepID=A0A1F6C445_HANXR|nr:MAG: restriction endonuclease subunit R [Candidatus Handelsmanbacteria bacterium RIFCSPLOWO2_12_FULL_64_10]
MNSRNFEFLRPHNRELADLGGFAERYVHSDPASALTKLRLFGENLTAGFFQHYQIPVLPKTNFLEFLQIMERQGLVPSVVLNKLHALRTQGNRAAHGSQEAIPAQVPIWILKEAFDLGKWFSLTVHADESVHSLAFESPEPEETKAGLKREKKAVLQKLAAQEAQMQKLLQELEVARQATARAEKTAEEQRAILARADQAANTLQFDEEATRKLLIDQLLVQAGWKVGPDAESTGEVGKEVEVLHQPTDSGTGYADYVLWDDSGKPLGVIEAKRTVHDSEKGRAQARWYAEGLEKQYDQRPVIFYTNGYDLWIWDDAKGEIPRRIYGFYSKDNLQRCLWKTRERKKLTKLGPKSGIIDRRYQIEAVKLVCERFDQNRRKALIVQATGTGKTRVAVALSELLIRARWVKRILFLCDRRELRKQAHNVFAQYLDAEPRVYVSAITAQDRDKSIYLATYPAMMKYFQSFDTGFFDLIIADESHRSIYNRYRDLFLYFDALQVGLTATPRKIVTHNTYKLFDCEDGQPTANFDYEEAIQHVPPYLAHFEVTSHTTRFLREGIRYTGMTDEQRQQLEEQVEDAEQVDYSREAVDKSVFNKDTDRRVLRNLMENGLRDATGQHVGKTILFARDHNHAIQLQRLFEEMYPQYMKPRKEFCAVIDNYVDRAEQLIDDFKGEGNNDNLTIAISVDMLDTGIDVPEVVNLVFAKPVKSYVKFWQMIGRGTRLCPDLFGPGKDKKHFCIFDHWGNFEYFGEHPPEVTPSVQKSLMQRIFEARMQIAEEALVKQNLPVFEMAVELIEKDVRALPEDTVSVQEKWRQVKTVQQEGVIRRFDAATVGLLRMEIAPLMQWRDLDGREDAYRLDLLIARLQESLLRGSGAFEDFKTDLQEQVCQLPVNLGEVAAKIDWIEKVKDTAFWAGVTIEALEEVRRELRGIMHCRNKPKVEKVPPLEIDVTDTEEQSRQEVVRLEGLDLAAYRHRVERVLNELFDESPVLQRIKAGQPVDESEIRPLIEKVIFRDPTLSVEDLLTYFPNKANRLDLAIRQIIGLDAGAVDRHFTRFVQKYPDLSSHQIRFLALIQKHIVNYGRLEVGKLYEDPFTQIHVEGVDGVFTSDAQIDDLLELISDINDLAPAGD